MRIAFTGNRPNNKYMGGYDYNSDKNRIIYSYIYNSVLNTILNNPDEKEFILISGGALGTDQLAAMACIDIKNRMPNKNIIIKIAIPFEKQDCKWPISSKNIYAQILKLADIITYVDTITGYECSNIKVGEYSAKKMILRDHYMIDELLKDDNNLLISVYDEESTTHSGTYETICYAKQKGVKILNINPKEI